MDETHKRSIRKVREPQFGKARTREEQKEIRERARKKKKSEEDGRRKPRQRAWRGEEEEEAGFERMVTARERPPLAAARAKRFEPPTPPPENARIGLVASVARGRALVILAGEPRELPLARALQGAQQGAIAVGDEAWVEHEGDEPARVVAVAERRSLLSRPDPADARRELVLAANVDVGVVVVTPERSLKLALVDRFLVALGRGGVAPVVCVNKLDLLTGASARAALEQALEPYRELEVPTLCVSAETQEGIAELRAELVGRTCVFVGQSGVGKSSLLNALDPEGARLVRATRAGDGKGRHTTSASSLTALADGTCVIDTPGIRQFGLWGIGPAELAEAFPEIAAAAVECRFADCSHVHEPGCGVRAAVERGDVPRARYDSYVRLAGELEER